jgi:tRNA(Ile)-lysidine synthase
MKFVWEAFDHKLHLHLRQRGALEKIQNKHLLVALSGGADSIALMHFLARARHAQKLTLTAMHLHHGEHDNVEYRNQALQLAQQESVKLNISFSSVINLDSKLHSEQQLRDFRHRSLQEKAAEIQADWIVFAHHADDLFETRILRLIRGTGAQGLNAMSVFDQNLFRPFLSISKQEILAYLNVIQASFAEDPSNQQSDYLRNWLRTQWLPLLEQKQPGSTASFSRSLDLISQNIELHNTSIPKNFDEKGIFRPEYEGLALDMKKVVLAQYILSLGIRDFGHTHIDEIKKHLDTGQIVHTFKIANLYWTANAERIFAEIP